MGEYRERLWVPASWWVLGLLTAVTLATTLWAGLSMAVAIASYVVFAGGCAAALLGLGRAVIEIRDGELRVGRVVVLPLRQATEVTALDAAQSRAMRGPRADPAAILMIRPYLPLAVYVGISGQRAPYLLLGTRRPDELAAAIDRARPGAQAGGTG